MMTMNRNECVETLSYGFVKVTNKKATMFDNVIDTLDGSEENQYFEIYVTPEGQLLAYEYFEEE